DRNVARKIAQAIEQRQFVVVEVTALCEQPVALIVAVKGLSDQSSLVVPSIWSIQQVSRGVQRRAARRFAEWTSPRTAGPAVAAIGSPNVALAGCLPYTAARRQPGMIDVVMPQLGESVAEGTVTRWLVSQGDYVSRDQTLVEVATDKADTEIPAPAAGVV